jgi:MATE family, multidrug efflux pump
MGNTLPPLATSVVRLLVVALPAFVMARRPDFELRWIWYLSVGAIAVQMVMTLLLLRREFRLRLVFDHSPPPAVAPASTA